MPHHKALFISNLTKNQFVEEVFSITSANRKEAKNGPYWQLTLQDKTGSIEARIWAPISLQYEDLKQNSFVLVNGKTDSYADKLQLMINKITEISQDEIDLADYMPSSKIPARNILDEIEELLNSELCYPPWKKLCKNTLENELIRKNLLLAPAAKNIHHAYSGGLLEHILSMMRLTLLITEHYPDLDREILLVAVLFHDLGKSLELAPTISREYTDSGRLIGHITLELEILNEQLQKIEALPNELAIHLKHLILSHHGELLFGSPKRPKTKEAFVLHYIDNIDAKMNTLNNIFKDEETSSWSDYNRVLERYLFNPMHTPNIHEKKQKNTTDSGAQCLLPLKG